ncbi:carbohydrate kinase family protein [Winogradskyella sp. PG-2]|uniref:carbohydrate kinase family protein n=1 Tax=Winogradskyella sp. PG-2 TaxID=754409 RepID=UPI0004588703|nr:carbohydrate kinase [Winogradskyella sp. PG-2]BAO76107.1 fructokinase [Winogradskyella sp. PG-2]
MKKIVCFGEILWDVFPAHKKIGGAPLNVALRLKSFGNEVVVISSVGQDSDGKKLLDFIKESNVNCDEIQVNKEYKTSHVKVMLDNKGSASYTIEKPCAWDYIKLTESSKRLVEESDAFIFGSLVTRIDFSRATLLELLEFSKFKVLDVNLRAPHYDIDFLKELMEKSDFIKFNDEELLEFCEYFNFKSDCIEEQIKFLSKVTNTSQICVTLGSEGAILFINNSFYRSLGYKVIVKDTVGSGDSFLATLIDGLLSNNQHQDSINLACIIGALVASKNGANPIIEINEIQSIKQT